MTDMHNVEVLLVEDNPQDAELAIRSLRKHGIANNIFTVEDGAEALDFINCRGKFATRDIAYLPKVIFLDLKLPRVNGFEVLKELKGNSRTRCIPVVIITSSREDPDIKSAYQLGANSYVTKPVEFDVFTETIEKLGYYWLMINQRSNSCYADEK